MSHARRRAWVKKLYQESLVKELIPYGKTDAKLLKIMLKQLQKEHVTSVVILGRVIYICKTKLPMVFAAVKQKR